MDRGEAGGLDLHYHFVKVQSVRVIHAVLSVLFHGHVASRHNLVRGRKYIIIA